MANINSCLVIELKKLMESSKEAVENLASFSNFKKYIHVQRQVELELLSILEIAANSSIPQLILVCGGVGDGKSHLISYMFQKYPVLLNNFQKHNDATESFEPNKTSIDTLNDVLNAFSDEHLDEGKPEKLILAINLGALNNFIDSEKYRDHFTKLRRYVNDKKILETTILNNSYDKDEFFQFINFSDYHMFTLNNTGPKSSYIYELIYKISNQNNNNPFYNTYVENCCSCMIQDKCPVKANYEFFMDQDVIEQITQLLIETMIKQKLIISTRSLLNFIFEAIVCNQLKSVHITEYKEILSKFSFSEYISSLTPNILFEQKDLSNIFDSLKFLDPICNRKEEVDQLIIQLNTIYNISQVFQKHIKKIYPSYFQKILDNQELLLLELENTPSLKEILTKTFLRMYLFKPKSTWLKLNDDIYLDYMQNLYWWNKGDKTKLKPLFDRIKESIYKWNGKSAPETINLFIGRNQLHYKISQRLSLSPVLNNLPQIPKNELHKFIPYLILEYKDFSKNTSYSISIDFSLYKLLMRIRKGYRPNRKDKNDFINFVEFIDKILKLGNQNKELFIEDRLENKRQFKLVFDSEFEQYSFEEMS